MGYSPWGRKESDTNEQLYSLASLRIISSSLHVAANGIIVLSNSRVIPHCIHVHIFIHSSVDVCLGCFHVLTVADSAAVSTGVHAQKPQGCRPGCLPPARCSLPAAGQQGAQPAVQTPPLPHWVAPGDSHQPVYHQSDTDQVLGSLPSVETD